MSSEKLTIGIIGAGRIGKLHASNLCKRVNNVCVKTIADTFMNEDTKAWAKSLGIENATADADDIFSDPDIDAVFVCGPTDTHVAYVIKSALAGKHVFCEKPVGSSPAQIQTALDAVKQAGVKMQVGFVRRFDHNHRAVAQAVKNGKIGKVEIVKVTSRDPEPPPMDYVKRSGGLFFDMMIHDFDMSRYLSGSEIAEVFAKGTAIISEGIADVGDIDTAVVTVTFENGAIGVIDNSRRASYGYDQRTEVHGSLGSVRTDNDTANLAIVSTVAGVSAEKPLWFFLERYNDAFVREEEAFRDAILENRPVAVSGEDALKNVLAAAAAQKSLQEGRPVKISEMAL